MLIDPADHHAALRDRLRADPAVRPRGRRHPRPLRNLRHPPTRWLYGFTGIWIAQLLAFTPIAFLVIIGTVEAVSPSLEEAARTLRASPMQTFRTVTLPLDPAGPRNAFLLSFIESMADFGNPIMLGGGYNVLSTDIFFSIVGARYDRARGNACRRPAVASP
jgi:ABC-type Fe3+ transport system permease subunit